MTLNQHFRGYSKESYTQKKKKNVNMKMWEKQITPDEHMSK
jgi:hypothetical protein